MEIQFYGANCVRISTKKFSVVVDDNLAKLGLKSVTKPTDISLNTSIDNKQHQPAAFTADLPGEYEISGAIIHGVAARGHRDEEGVNKAVIYTIEADDARVAVTGHIYPDLSDEQLEQIGLVDVLITPVGNHGYTMDGAGALAIIKKIEPKVVIPTHYADKTVKYEVPQAELAEATKVMGMEPAEKLDRFKFKPAEAGDAIKLIVLERQ